MPQLHHLLYQGMCTNVTLTRFRPPVAQKFIILYIANTVVKADSAILYLVVLRSSISSPFLRVFSRGPSKYGRFPFHAMIRGPSLLMLRCILDLSMSVFSLTAKLDHCFIRLVSMFSRLAVVYCRQLIFHLLRNTVISASNLVILFCVDALSRYK